MARFIPLQFARDHLLDVIGVAIICLFCFAVDSLMGDPGVGWHLKTGEIIATTGQVPKSDPFLQSEVPVPWVADQWLSDLLFYSLYRWGGFSLLHVACVLILVSTFIFTVARAMGRILENELCLFFLIILMLLCAHVQWFCRPVILSFLFFSVVLIRVRSYFMSKPRMPQEMVWGTFFFCLWANIHPAFVLGQFVLGIGFLEAICMRRERADVRMLFGLCIASVLGALINPYGVGLYQSIFALISNDYFMNLNMEWLPPELFDSLFVWFFLALGVVATLFLLLPLHTFRLYDVILVVVFSVLACNQRRYIPFFAVPFGIFSSHACQMLLQGKGRIVFSQIPLVRLLFSRRHGFAKSRMSVSIVLLFLVFSYTAVFGEIPLREGENPGFPENYPKRAITYLAAQDATAKIFHTPDWGGYIVFNLWPAYAPFIDDRNNANDESKYKEYFIIRNGEEGWNELIEKYQFRWLLLQPDDQLIPIVKRSPQWREVVEVSDKSALLFERIGILANKSPQPS